MRTKPVLIRGGELQEDGRVIQKTMRADQIHPAPKPYRDSLSEQQADKAKQLWDRIGKFFFPTKDLAYWINGFRFDCHLDNELEKWRKIAAVVDAMWPEPICKSITKNTLIRAVVAVDSGVVDIPAHLPGVTDKLVERIRMEFASIDATQAEKFLTWNSSGFSNKNIVPISRLFDETGFGPNCDDDPRPAIMAADAVFVVDIKDQRIAMVYGVATMQRLAAGDERDFRCLTVGIDRSETSDDLGKMIVLMENFRGEHHYSDTWLDWLPE